MTCFFDVDGDSDFVSSPSPLAMTLVGILTLVFCAGLGLHLSTSAWILALISIRTSTLLVLTCGAVRSASQGIGLWSAWLVAGEPSWMS